MTSPPADQLRGILEDDDVDVVGRPSRRRVTVQRLVDLVEDLGGIGTVVRLEHGLEPFFAEEGVGRDPWRRSGRRCR